MQVKRSAPEMTALLKRAADGNPEVAIAAQLQIAKALESPIRDDIWFGDIIGDTGIFETEVLEPGQQPEYPKSWLTPGSVKDLIAVVCPNIGRVPERSVTGDYVTVPTYKVMASLNTPLDYIRDGRWKIVESIKTGIVNMYTAKVNDDGWHTLLAAGNTRNVVVQDGNAAAGLFTKRLIALAKTSMRRNAGGNTTSQKQGALTDVFGSLESIEDIRSWDLTQIDDFSRRQIYVGEDSDVIEIFKTRLHGLTEFGVGQKYELYYENTLGGTLSNGKLEIMVGLDLKNRDSFVHPVREEFKTFVDPNLHRQMEWGLYGWASIGFGVLDNRRIILLSY